MMNHAHPMESCDPGDPHAEHHGPAPNRAPFFGVAVQGGSADVGYANRTHSVYFENSMQIQRPRWGIDAALPVIVRHSESETLKGRGIGDLHLRGGFHLLPALTIGATAKFPTGDAEKGFGSGKWDGGVFAALAHGGHRIRFSAEATWLVVGDPPGVDYRNPILFSGGISVGVIPRLELSLQYASSTSWTDNLAAPQQIHAGLQWKADDQVSIFTHVTAGLSSSVPDLNLSFGIRGPL